MRRRPEPDELDAFYATYVDKVPDGDILDILEAQHTEALALYRGLTPADLDHRYAAGKWSVREVVGHLVDTEWVFTTRALRIARGDTTPLPGVDQDVLIAGADFAHRPFESLVTEYDHLRSAGRTLFASFGDQVLDRRGTASGFPISVRALLYIVAGHERHHHGVLRERSL